MINQCKLSYKIARLFEGVHEISGSKHNPIILDFGKIVTLDIDTDEIPWCSNFMNTSQALACIIINPGLFTRIMSNRGEGKHIKCLVDYSIMACEKLELLKEGEYLKSKDWTRTANQLSNGLKIVEPTYSALASSWKNWGVETLEPQEGDLAVFKRRPDGSGSGHIAYMAGFSGRVERFVYAFGGNQSNEVNFSNYELDRVVTYRTIP